MINNYGRKRNKSDTVNNSLTFSNRWRMHRGNELLDIWSMSFIDISANSLG